MDEMGVPHGVLDALVAQDFLDEDEILGAVEGHGGAPVTECVEGDGVDSWILQGYGNPSLLAMAKQDGSLLI